jgi:hypothetical protein
MNLDLLDETYAMVKPKLQTFCADNNKIKQHYATDRSNVWKEVVRLDAVVHTNTHCIETLKVPHVASSH